MIVNIHKAKTDLSKLIERAEAGEEVVIARAGSPRVRLTPVDPPSAQRAKSGKLPAWVGSMKGKIWIAPDIEETENAIARAFDESEIFPDEKPR
jgi:prevent-host-death family protein